MLSGYVLLSSSTVNDVGMNSLLSMAIRSIHNHQYFLTARKALAFTDCLKYVSMCMPEKF